MVIVMVWKSPNIQGGDNIQKAVWKYKGEEKDKVDAEKYAATLNGRVFYYPEEEESPAKRACWEFLGETWTVDLVKEWLPTWVPVSFQGKFGRGRVIPYDHVKFSSPWVVARIYGEDKMYEKRFSWAAIAQALNEGGSLPMEEKW